MKTVQCKYEPPVFSFAVRCSEINKSEAACLDGNNQKCLWFDYEIYESNEFFSPLQLFSYSESRGEKSLSNF